MISLPSTNLKLYTKALDLHQCLFLAYLNGIENTT
jgi:hypothetical protein